MKIKRFICFGITFLLFIQTTGYLLYSHDEKEKPRLQSPLQRGTDNPDYNTDLPNDDDSDKQPSSQVPSGTDKIQTPLTPQKKNTEATTSRYEKTTSQDQDGIKNSNVPKIDYQHRIFFMKKNFSQQYKNFFKQNSWGQPQYKNFMRNQRKKEQFRDFLRDSSIYEKYRFGISEKNKKSQDEIKHHHLDSPNKKKNSEEKQLGEEKEEHNN